MSAPPSLGPNVANPSISFTPSPASATAAFTARAASENTLAPESLENSVAPDASDRRLVAGKFRGHCCDAPLQVTVSGGRSSRCSTEETML